MGSFLASGSVNDPASKHYHLEMVTHSDKNADFLVKFISKFELNAKLIKRRNVYVIYIKKSEEISDFLRVINANNCVLDFEEERINKDYFKIMLDHTVIEKAHTAKIIGLMFDNLLYEEKGFFLLKDILSNKYKAKKQECIELYDYYCYLILGVIKNDKEIY